MILGVCVHPLLEQLRYVVPFGHRHDAGSGRTLASNLLSIIPSVKDSSKMNTGFMLGYTSLCRGLLLISTCFLDLLLVMSCIIQ